MYSHQDRCDRTAYVAGLLSTISDIELFEVFNKVAHVEKVIVRNSSSRHALVVFKTIEGLYMALVHFQGIMLHGRQLHIRPLRESSHNSTNDGVQSFSDQRNRRTNSVQEKFPPPTNFYTQNYNNNSNNKNFSYARNSSNRRRSSYNRNCHPQQMQQVDMFYSPQQQFTTFKNEIQFEDHSEGAKRFDNLANLIRGHNPMNPYISKLSQGLDVPKSRSNSAKDSSKPPPPTWKMELQIKKENEVPDGATTTNQVYRENPEQAEKMTAQQLLAKFSCCEGGGGKENVDVTAENGGRKKRPNLSVVNPSLFYEQYPRTSSPLAFGNSSVPEKVSSPHDPAVLAYRRARAPTTIADLSPIDVQDCSFVTKHFAENKQNAIVNQPEKLGKSIQTRREMTNEELSDMIVSTGNLRIDLQYPNNGTQFNDEPAPWSPVKRIRAESGSLSMIHMNSPQFSPIKTETVELDDDVFCSGSNVKAEISQTSTSSSNNNNSKKCNNLLLSQKLMNCEDITNCRLPSNCHSANPSSDKRVFVFPNYSPLCRHESIPSLTNFVSDMSDFGIGFHSQHVSIGEKLVGNTSDENSTSFKNVVHQPQNSMLKAEPIE